MGISLRFKIVMLLTAAVTVSLALYLKIGTALLVRDRTSYLGDFNHARVRSRVEKMDAQLEKSRMLAKVLGRLLSTAPRLPLIEEIYRERAGELRLAGMAFLRPRDADKFEVAFSYGKNAKGMHLLPGLLAWSPRVLEARQLTTGSASPDSLVLGGMSLDGEGKPLAYLVEIIPDPTGGVPEEGEDLRFQILDSAGKSLFKSSAGSELDFSDPGLKSLEGALFRNRFSSGAQEAAIGGVPSVISYQRFEHEQLLAVGWATRESVFASTKALERRSLVLGTGILLVTLSLAFWMVRNLTRKLHGLWEATQHIAKGDFSFRATAAVSGKDEVGSLARAFDTMTEKIGDLVRQTEEKARMEVELETARAVQNRFFPETDFAAPGLSLAGRFLPASECAGDWWHYVRAGDHLIVLIGDVTGHGVSAALVTAAVFSAFSVFAEEALLHSAVTGMTREELGALLTRLIEQLNTAVHRSSKGEATFPMVLSAIHLQTGEVLTANASHCMPIVCRWDAASGRERYFPLVVPGGPPVGEDSKISVDLASAKLEPGDRVLWYTDGLLDCRGASGKSWSKLQMLGALTSFSKDSAVDSGRLCELLVDRFRTVLGEGLKEREDDVTVVIGRYHGPQGSP